MDNSNCFQKEDTNFLESFVVKEEYIAEDEYEGEPSASFQNQNDFFIKTKSEEIDWNTLAWCCQFCYNSFYGYKIFHAHIDSSHQSLKSEFIYHECLDCGAILNSYSLYIEHARNVHYECLKLSCDVCCEIFSNYKQLSEHRNQHLDESNSIYPALYYCFECEDVLSDKKELGDHFKNSHNSPEMEANESSNEPSAIIKTEEIDEPKHKYGKFENELECVKFLKKQCTKIKGNYSFKCLECKKTFATAKHLKEHKLLLNCEFPFQCSICGKDFRLKESLENHLIFHEEQRFKCEICSLYFISPGSLMWHNRRHKKNEIPNCNVCKKTFINLSNLKGHMSIHTGERPYKCDICKKSFRRKDILKTHAIIHTSARSHKCEICLKTFLRPGELSIHFARMHTDGDRPYKCEICSKAFFLPTELKSHMRIHVRNCPFKCKLCWASFKYSKNLEYHLKTRHEGE